MSNAVSIENCSQPPVQDSRKDSSKHLDRLQFLRRISFLRMFPWQSKLNSIHALERPKVRTKGRVFLVCVVLHLNLCKVAGQSHWLHLVKDDIAETTPALISAVYVSGNKRGNSGDHRAEKSPRTASTDWQATHSHVDCALQAGPLTDSSLEEKWLPPPLVGESTLSIFLQCITLSQDTMTKINQ